MSNLKCLLGHVFIHVYIEILFMPKIVAFLSIHEHRVLDAQMHMQTNSYAQTLIQISASTVKYGLSLS